MTLITALDNVVSQRLVLSQYAQCWIRDVNQLFRFFFLSSFFFTKGKFTPARVSAILLSKAENN